MKTKSKPGFVKRSRLEIMTCILANSIGGSRKTRLIYGCNLSLSQFNQYKDCLVEAGLLEVSRQSKIEIFETTEKGKEFLSNYRKIETALNKMRL